MNDSLRRRATGLSLTALRIAGWCLAALATGFLIQVLTAIEASVRTGAPEHDFTSRLLDQSAPTSIVVALRLFAGNLPALGCFAVAAIVIGLALDQYYRTHMRAWILGSLLLPASMLIVLSWLLSAQVASVAGVLNVSPLVLILALPHGPLELASFVIPVLASFTIRRQAMKERGRAIFLSLLIAIALLSSAAIVETWVSPVLVSILRK